MMGRKAVLHIFTTYNNVLMTATDLTGAETIGKVSGGMITNCLLYTSPSPRDKRQSRMPSSA